MSDTYRRGEAAHVEDPTHVVYVREVVIYRVEFKAKDGMTVRETAESILDNVEYDLLSNFMEVQERDIENVTDIDGNEFWTPTEEDA